MAGEEKLITLDALSLALPSWIKRSTKPSYTADDISTTGTTNQFVTANEKNTWDGKYALPSGGIPKTDFASAVQTSLEKADSAIQTETDPTVPSWAKQQDPPTYTSDDISDTNQTHKFATAEQLQQISTNQTNILSISTELATKGTYSKPSGGIPKTDLASSVQASLDKADTALQFETYTGTVTQVKVGSTSYDPSSGVVSLPAYPTPNTYTGSGAISVNSSTKVISHSTSAGYKHIPSGGSAGQFLKYSSSGTASWQPLPYASESAQGAVRIWTTTVGSDTVLHISNEAAT